MERLNLSVNGIENATSPATALGKLQEALQLYSAAPSNRNLAETTLDAAREVVRTLNDGTSAIQSFRSVADQEISTAVGELNNLLADLEKANNAVISGTRSGRDVSDALDQRDATLKKIAEYVPISTFTRGDNDMVVLTKDGSTLFETVPRSVSFTPTSVYAPGTTGGKVFIDGVPVDLAAGGNTNASGRIAGMIQLRDGVTVTMQSQLDEIARGLITAFAETSPTNALPRRARPVHLVRRAGDAAAGTLVNGLAGQIRLNPAIDSAQGGNPELLRDGGANGAGYVHNTGGNASYSGLLIAYGDRIDAPMSLRSRGRHRRLVEPQRLFDRRHRLVRRHAQGSVERRRIQGGARRAHGRGALQRDRRQCRHGNVAAARPRTFLRGVVAADPRRRRDARRASRRGEVAR